MKRFVEGADRGQSTLLPECLDEWVEESLQGGGHPAREQRWPRRAAEDHHRGGPEQIPCPLQRFASPRGPTVSCQVGIPDLPFSGIEINCGLMEMSLIETGAPRYGWLRECITCSATAVTQPSATMAMMISAVAWNTKARMQAKLTTNGTV
jgi:hypothetical protein